MRSGDRHSRIAPVEHLVAEVSRVLIVDDNPVNRKLLAAILEREGYEFRAAKDGHQALKFALEWRPHLVLLDVMMPGLDGYEVCARLKDDERTVDTPILFLTSLTETAQKVRGLQQGAVDWITKPFDRGEVLARVRNQMRLRRLTMSLQHANRELESRHAAMREDLRAAAGIQRSLIPRSAPVSDKLEMAWRFAPCDSVGGDIFNLLPLDDRHLAFYVLDVSGHGVPAAMVTVSVVQTLSPTAGIVIRPPQSGDITSPGAVMELLDREYPVDRFGKYFTIGYLVLDTKSGLLKYSCAAHPHPVLIRAGGTLELLDRGGTIIGLDGAIPFEEGEVQLATGDRLYLYTDGITDQPDEDGEAFGPDRLSELLADLAGEPLQSVCDAVMENVSQWADGRPPMDDMTIVAMEYREPEEP